MNIWYYPPSIQTEPITSIDVSIKDTANEEGIQITVEGDIDETDPTRRTEGQIEYDSIGELTPYDTEVE